MRGAIIVLKGRFLDKINALLVNAISARARNYFFSGKTLLIRCAKRAEQRPDSFFEHVLNDLECVVREDYIIGMCGGKRVLHLGFLDSPLTTERIKSGNLLHSKLDIAAKYLYGVDIDDNNIKEYRRLTGDDHNCVLDILKDDANLSFFENRFDIILFSEVLEHLKNPGMALQKLKEICMLNPSSQLLITVPNAFSLEHFVSAANYVEMVHPDHYHYYSPVTLKKLILDSGFSNVKIKLYAHSENMLNIPGITSHGIIALCKV